MTTSLWGAGCSLSSVKAWVKVCMIRDLPQRLGPWAFQSSAAKRDLKIIGKPWENHEKTMRKPRKISESWKTYGKLMENIWETDGNSFVNHGKKPLIMETMGMLWVHGILMGTNTIEMWNSTKTLVNHSSIFFRVWYNQQKSVSWFAGNFEPETIVFTIKLIGGFFRFSVKSILGLRCSWWTFVIRPLHSIKHILFNV